MTTSALGHVVEWYASVLSHVRGGDVLCHLGGGKGKSESGIFCASNEL